MFVSDARPCTGEPGGARGGLSHHCGDVVVIGDRPPLYQCHYMRVVTRIPGLTLHQMHGMLESCYVSRSASMGVSDQGCLLQSARESTCTAMPTAGDSTTAATYGPGSRKHGFF